MASMEKEVVRLMAQEIISAIKKVNENNNKNYVDAQLRNAKVAGIIGGSSSGSGGAIPGNTISASQVVDLYSTVAGFISRAPANSNLGDVDAGKIISTIAGLAALEIQSATIDTAQIENLYASYGEFINLVAKNAEIESLDVEQVRADIAEMGLANIESADIGWAQIKDLVTNTAIIREGVGGKLYIDRLAVTDAQILSLTTGELIIQGSDGKLYTVFVDENGNVQTELRVVTGIDIGGGTIHGENIAENTITGALITEHGITARELNVSQIFADEALIRAIKAANLDVDDLFANEAFINVLTTSIINSPTIGKDIDISNNSSIVLTDKKIGLVVSSESTETELVLTDQMMEVIADQVQVSADTIDFSANESITAVVQREVAGVTDTIIVGSEPQQPVIDMVWLDTSVDPNVFKRWNGTDWELIGDVADLASRMDSAEFKIDANTASIESSAESIDSLNTRVQSAEEKITPEAITQTVRDSQGYKDDIASATMTSEKFETFVWNSQSISDMEMTAEKFETYVENSQGIADLEMTAEKFETFVENSEGISKLEMTPEKFETFVEGSEGISSISQKADEIDFVLENGSSSTNVNFTSAAINAISRKINLKANDEFNLVIGDLETTIKANSDGIEMIAGEVTDAKSTADSASKTASTAQTTANSAKTAAATAQSTADSAKTAANNAQASIDNLGRLTNVEVIEGNFVQAERREGEAIHLYSEFGPKRDQTYGEAYPGGSGKNVLPNSAKSTTANGVTFTVNPNGSIAIDGTASVGFAYAIYQSTVYLPAGEYIASRIPGGSNQTYYATFYRDADHATRTNIYDSDVQLNIAEGGCISNFRIYIPAGVTIDNIVYYPMVRPASVSDASYAPYENKTPLEGRTELNAGHAGMNLAPAHNPSPEVAGLTCSVSGGVFTISGTTTQNVRFDSEKIVLPPGTYTIKPNQSALTDVALYMRKTEGGTAFGSVNMKNTLTAKSTFTLLNPTEACVSVYITSGKTVDVSFSIMLNRGSTSLPFVPYSGDNYVVDFGEIVYGGTVDWFAGELIADRALVTLNGTENWTASSTNTTGKSRFYASGINSGILSPPNTSTIAEGLVCSHYKAAPSTTGGSYQCVPSIGIYTSGTSYFYDERYAGGTAADWKAYVAAEYAAGTPIQYTYKLKNPTRIQLTPVQLVSLSGMNTVYTDADGGWAEFGRDFYDIVDSTMPPASAKTGTLWLDRSVTPAVLRRYSGSEWETVNDVTLIETVQDALLTKQAELEAAQKETALFLKLDSANKVVRIGQTGVTSEYRIDAFGSGVVVNNEIFSRFEANRVLFGNMEIRRPAVGGLAFDSIVT